MSEEEMPICQALFNHVAKARGPLHVPGHQQGRTLPARLDLWLGQAAKLDLTELPGLDNLAQPEGCILQSQELAAKAYGSEMCLYSVNGSSAGIMAAILATTTPDTTVLFANPFHISAWHGLVHSGANALRAGAKYNADGRQGTVNLAALTSALDKHPEIGVVYVTSPTYLGDVSDIAAISDQVHRRGLLLIVDEAHGAHFGLHPCLPQNSVQAGADIVIHSVHKMLPGLTQTAWIHSQGNRVDRARLAASLRSLQSTSPSYLLLASLDAAQFWLRSEGPAAAERTLQRLQRAGLWSRPGKGEPTQGDMLKHWVCAPTWEAARELAHRLTTRGLYPEYVDTTGVLSILGLDISDSTLTQYADIVNQWKLDRDASPPGHTLPVTASRLAVSTEMEGFAMRPRDTLLSKRAIVPLAQGEGRVLGEPLVPYPPGVPVLYPGQVLTAEWIGNMEAWHSQGREIHGIDRRGNVTVLA